VFENRVLRIFGPKRDEVTGGWRKLHNDELHNLTLQHGGIQTPVHTVMWEGFSTGHLNFELNCAGVYSK
jgi:hypothetical protein